MSSSNQLANVLTTKGAYSIELLNVLKSGIIHIQYSVFQKKQQQKQKQEKHPQKINDKKNAKVLIIVILSSIS